VTALGGALWAELLKARRSRGPWLSALALSLAPAMGALFMVILRDPEWARRAGLISTKAQITAGSADWPTYFGLLGQATAIGGFMVFGLILTWVFGREYGDRAAKDLLALPASREAIVAAKLVVYALWSAALAALVLALGVLFGSAIGLAGWSAALALRSAATLAEVALMTILGAIPIALVASVGRGYFPPVGALVLTVFLSQIAAALGWGAYFPWAIPALASGAAGPSAQELGLESYAIVGLDALLGLVGTLAWWRWADQT